jgi:hypothetical protein
MICCLRNIFVCFLAFGMLLSFKSVKAQKTGFHPGSIVTLENDTIEGFVKNINSFPYRILPSIKFKRTLKGKASLYGPLMISSFRIVDEIYESKILYGSSQFLKLVAAGNVNLYEKTSVAATSNPLGGTYWTKYTDHYLGKKYEDNLTKVEGLHFKKRLCNYFSDAPSICEKIISGQYKRKNILEIVEEYNSEDRGNKTVNSSISILQVSSRKFSFGLKGGLNLSSTLYRDLPVGFKNEREYNVGGHLGLFFRFKLSDRLSLNPEAQFISKRLNLRVIQVPLILSYSIRDRINIEAGPHFEFLLNSSSKRINLFDEAISVPSDYGFNVGLRIKFSERLSLSTRYNHGMRDILTWYENGIPLSTSGYDRNIQISTYIIIIKSR